MQQIHMTTAEINLCSFCFVCNCIHLALALFAFFKVRDLAVILRSFSCSLHEVDKKEYKSGEPIYGPAFFKCCIITLPVCLKRAPLVVSGLISG